MFAASVAAGWLKWFFIRCGISDVRSVCPWLAADNFLFGGGGALFPVVGGGAVGL